MAKPTTGDKVTQVLHLLKGGDTPDVAKAAIGGDANTWARVSQIVYATAQTEAEAQREIAHSTPHTLTTSNDELKAMVKVNQQLVPYALQLPNTATMQDYQLIEGLLPGLPATEAAIVDHIGKIVLAPQLRAVHKLGRFAKLPPFQEFTKYIDAATLSYYRRNYISCFLTLVPVVEGIIMRWKGAAKASFETLRKFFKQGYLRQPYPSNAQFHRLYSEASDAILNQHLFMPSDHGGVAHAHFNRHQAAHMLQNVDFANKANCIRLFLMLDMMTEIYTYEAKNDPRNLVDSLSPEVDLYIETMMEHPTDTTAEDTLLG